MEKSRIRSIKFWLTRWLVCAICALLALFTIGTQVGWAQVGATALRLISVPTQMVLGHGPSADFELDQKGVNVSGKEVNDEPLSVKESNWKSEDGDVHQVADTTWYRVDASGHQEEIASAKNKLVYTPQASDIGKKIRLIAKAASQSVDGSYTPSPDKGAPITITTGFVRNRAGVVSVAVDAAKTLSDGTTQATFTAKVETAAGTPVANVEVDFTPSGIANAKFEPVGLKVMTDANGLAKLKVSSDTNGIETVSAFQKELPSVVKENKTQFMWYEVKSLAAEKTDVVANKANFNTLNAQVEAPDGTPAPDGIDVTVTKPRNDAIWFVGQAASVDSVDIKTSGGAGRASVGVSSTQAASFVMSAITKVKGADTQTQSISFVADPQTAYVKNLTVPTDAVLANGSKADVSAQVVDANGNMVGGALVQFSGDKEVSIPANAYTDVSGVAKAQASSDTAGTFKVNAKTDKTATTVTKSITFKVDTADAQVDSIKVTKNDALANAKDENEVTAVIKDKSGKNLVPAGVEVAFTANNGAVVGSPVKTIEGGLAVAKVTNTKSGTASITAAVGKSSKAIDVNFKADASTAKVSKTDFSVISKTDAPADGASYNEIKAIVTDASGNILQGIKVDFSASPSGAIITPENGGVSDVNGVVLARITSTKANSYVITPSIKGVAQAATVTVTFVPDNASGHVETFDVLTKNGVIADGLTPNKVQAKVEDKNGNPVAGAVVGFSVDGNPVAYSLKALRAGSTGPKITPTATTDAQGLATAEVTYIKAGNLMVHAVVGATPAKDTKVTFLVNTATAKVQSLVVSPGKDNAAANGTATNEVQAQVVDANDNVVGAGVAVNFSSKIGSTIVTTPVVTDASGIAKAQVKSDKAGVYTVDAWVGSEAHTTIPVTFVADVSTAKVDAITAMPPNNAVADGVATNKVAIEVRDAKNNTVPNAEVTLSVSGTGATIAATAKTDNDGVVVVPVSSTVAGKFTVTAKAKADTDGKTADVNFKANASTARVVAAIVDPNGAVADGVAANKVAIEVKDKNNNPVSGVKVTFTTPDGVAVSAPATDINGKTTASVTSTKMGLFDIIAKANTSDTGKTVTGVNFIANAKTAQVKGITAAPGTVTSDGKAFSTVTVLVKDANDNVVKDAKVSLDVGTSKAVVTPATGTTDDKGEFKAKVTNTKAEDVTVSAKAVDGVATPMTAKVQFTADAASALVKTLTIMSGNNGAANGIDEIKLDAKVEDSSGNPVSGAVVVFTSDRAGVVIAAPSATNADGVTTAVVKTDEKGVKTAGDYVISAQVGTTAAQKATVTFKADMATARVRSLTVPMAAVTADGSKNPITAQVQDNWQNPVDGMMVSFASSPDGATIVAGKASDAAGNAVSSIMSTKAGSYNVTAKVGNNQGMSKAVVFTADTTTAEVFALNVTPPKSPVIADGVATNEIEAVVKDASGNAVAGIAPVFASADGLKITPVGDGKSDAQGLVKALVTSEKAGSNFTVSAKTPTGKTSATAQVSFIANKDTAKITLATTSKDGATANGTAQNEVAVTVQDAKNNPVPNAVVNFVSSVPAKVSVQASATTDASGMVKVPVTSTQAGPFKITASVTSTGGGTTSKVVDMKFVADNSSAKVQTFSIEAGSNNAIADGSAQNKVQLTVVDANGNLVSGAQVSLAAINGASGVKVESPVMTDAQGAATAWVTSTAMGSYSFKAQVTTGGASSDTGMTVSGVNFIANKATAKVFSFTPMLNGQIAGSSVPNEVKVVVKDANGNLVKDAPITMTGAPVGAVITLPNPAQTDVNGELVAKVSSIIAQTYDLTAKAVADTTGMATKVNFVGNTATAKLISTEITNNDAPADKVSKNTITVQVADANGNLLSGFPLYFGSDRSFTPDGTPMTRNRLVSATTGPDGKAQFSVVATVVRTAEGKSPWMGVTFENKPIDSVITGKSWWAYVNFTPDAKTAQVALAVKTTGKAANGSEQDVVTATVKDANGNPIKDKAVTFTAASGAVVTPTATTDAQGVATAFVTSKKAATFTVTAALTGVAQTSSVDVSFIADESTAQVLGTGLTLLTTSGIADGKTGNEVEVLAVDANGNPVPKANIKFDGGNGSTIGAVVLTPNSSATDNTNKAFATTGANGKVKVTVTSLKFSAGAPPTNWENNAWIGATIKGKSRLPETFKVLPFVADAKTAGITQANFTKTTTTNPVANGIEKNSLKAVVTDAQGNFVPGAVVTLGVTPDKTSTVITSSGVSNAKGEVTFDLTSTSAGNYTVVPIVGGVVQTNTSIKLKFIPNKANARVATLTTVVDGAAADGVKVDTIKLRVDDADGNYVRTAGVKITGPADVSITMPNPAVTDANGELTATVTSKKAATFTLTAMATDNSADKGKTINVKFVADTSTAKLTDVKITKENAVANKVDVASIEAKVVDANGNPLEAFPVYYGGDRDFATDGSPMSDTRLIPGKSDATGKVTFSVTAIYTNSGVGNYQPWAGFSLTNEAIKRVDDKQWWAYLKFIGDKATASVKNLTVTSTDQKADGKAVDTVTALVKDINGNLVPDADVTFTVAAGANVVSTPVKTDANGNAVGSITSLKAGTYSVTAKIGAEAGQSKDVKFVADASTAMVRADGLTVLTKGGIADGKTGDEVEVMAVDANGNPVPNADIKVDGGNGSTIDGIVLTINASATDDDHKYFTKTGSDGRAKFTVTSLQYSKGEGPWQTNAWVGATIKGQARDGGAWRVLPFKNVTSLSAVDTSTEGRTFLNPGTKVVYTATSGYNGTPQYASSDASVATVDAGGNITWKKTGYAKFTVTLPATDSYTAATASTPDRVYAVSIRELMLSGGNVIMTSPVVVNAEPQDDQGMGISSCRNNFLVPKTNFLMRMHAYWGISFTGVYAKTYSIEKGTVEGWSSKGDAGAFATTGEWMQSTVNNCWSDQYYDLRTVLTVKNNLLGVTMDIRGTSLSAAFDGARGSQSANIWYIAPGYS